jgi:hypothetical protein
MSGTTPMIATALSALFAFAALSAIVVIAAAARQFGGSALAARAALRDCPEFRSLTYQISEVHVRRAPAQVLTLPVRPKVQNFPQPDRRAA